MIKLKTILFFLLCFFPVITKAYEPVLKIIETGDGLYLGKLDKNKYSGPGIMLYRNGDYYIGNWMNGRHDGPGILYKADKNCGSRYWSPVLFCNWKQGKPVSDLHYENDEEHVLFGNTENGIAAYQSNYPLPKTLYIGNFSNNAMSGLCVIELIDSTMLIGFIKNNAFYNEKIVIDSSTSEISHYLIDDNGIETRIYLKKRYPEYFFN